MKVILTQDVDPLGRKGEVVEVKPGYGRNYLIPRGLALVATPGNVRRYEEELRQQRRKLEQASAEAQALARRISLLEVAIQKPVGEGERIFGTVTAQDVADELARLGIEVDRRKITLSDDVRTLGTYTATVRVHPDHTAELTVKVVPESLQESI